MNESEIEARDAKTQAAVEELCKIIGYGRVMQIAAELWKKIDPVGALTLGPCAGLVIKPAKGGDE